MGQLVFQAALGGQVNLVGPNTASTLNINVPAFAGTMASLASVNNNGVAYVNSSGQPTTLSTFVFDGTNVGIGTASPASKLNIVDASATVNVQLESGSVVGQYFASTSAGGVYVGSSSAHPLVFRTNTTERMRIDSSGSALIGVSATTPVWDERLGVRLDTTGTGQVAFGAYAPSTSYASSMIRVQAENATGTAWNILEGRGNVGGVKVTIDGNGKGSFLGGAVVNGVNGLGYATGAGGTVTQATNKSTGVTLNKPTGQITMNNAALAANTTVQFSCANSVVAATDTVVLTPAAATVDMSFYQWGAATNGPGQILIYLRNISGGSRSEAVVFNFAIIKGATS